MTEYLQPGGTEPVDDARRQRRLRPDDRQIDGIRLRKRQQTYDIRILQGHTFRLLRNPSISGCAVNLADFRRPAQRLHDGVLPPAAAYDQYRFFHLEDNTL